MPVIIGDQFGVHKIGHGKVMFSYGGAGLLAPWITGWIFVKMGGYTLALLIGMTGKKVGVGKRRCPGPWTMLVVG